ncbi:hypothetical protein [Burkholderia cenocepacia]|uniref:hypothetical protein n=1 Tax=Burkholderia cenocepacia TaxID=95486 RepID=UPI0026567E63|nr:hypothetical protein [Burkholderia cenocepacia]MDN7457301.1 hypothetical protein [Burkholderia cenocepacia]
MNQGKKPRARRLAPSETQNRRVLRGAGSTICGASGVAGRRERPRYRAFVVAARSRQEGSRSCDASARRADAFVPAERIGVDPAHRAAAGKQANRPIRAAAALAE